MKALLDQTKPSAKRGAFATIEISVGSTKKTYYLTKEQALSLAKQRVLQIGTPGTAKLKNFRASRIRTSRTARERAIKQGQIKLRARKVLEQSSDQQVEYVKSLKEAEGGAWSSAEYEKIAEISRQALKQRRDNFSIVYWTDAKGHCWYPKWQFDMNNQVIPEVRQILELLSTHDTYHVLTTFLVPAIGNSGESPLHLIQAGRGADAVEFVRESINER